MTNEDQPAGDVAATAADGEKKLSKKELNKLAKAMKKAELKSQVIYFSNFPLMFPVVEFTTTISRVNCLPSPGC